MNKKKNHCRAAQDLLAQTVIEQQAEVAILSEPYKDRHEGVWQHSSVGRAVIWSCGQPPGHLSQRASRTGYTRAKINGIPFYSSYIAPSVHISEFRTIMQEIADDTRGGPLSSSQVISTHSPQHGAALVRHSWEPSSLRQWLR